MNQAVPPIIQAEAREAASVARQPRKKFSPKLRSAIAFLWKYFAGAALCQSFVGSIVIVGWTYRLAQRTVLKLWWKQSVGAGAEANFRDFIAGSSQTQGHARWPNWIVQPNFSEVWTEAKEPRSWHRFRALARGTFHSLWQNVRLGAQGIFNTWVLTAPACLLWLFAWYDGWNNSFNKGYEQAVVGPLTGVVGVVLFIAAMFYVPLAQARQAATGQWRSFYQFRLVWSLIRRRWLACVGLAALYSALSLPVMILKALPAFFPQLNIPALVNPTNDYALHVLKAYFFWAGFVIFPAFVILRVVAARIYAGAMLGAVQSGATPEDALADVEWEALNRLDLLQVRPKPPRHVLVRAVTWAGTRAGRLTAGGLIFLLWFTLVAQIFTTEFLIYHPFKGWLNQPLVQLPWFNYIPGNLK